MFIIAVADSDLHENEIIFIDEVARIFGIPEDELAAIRARHADCRHGCASCEVLASARHAAARGARDGRELIRENHPDRAIARGLPPEAIRLAETRTRALNEAGGVSATCTGCAPPEGFAPRHRQQRTGTDPPAGGLPRTFSGCSMRRFLPQLFAATLAAPVSPSPSNGRRPVPTPKPTMIRAAASLSAAGQFHAQNMLKEAEPYLDLAEP